MAAVLVPKYRNRSHLLLSSITQIIPYHHKSNTIPSKCKFTNRKKFSPSSLLLATAALLTTTATVYGAGDWGINGTALIEKGDVVIEITVIDKVTTGLCNLNASMGKFPIKDYKVSCQNPGYSLILDWVNFDSQLLATLGTPKSLPFKYDAQIYHCKKTVRYDPSCKIGFIYNIGAPNGVAFSGNQQVDR